MLHVETETDPRSQLGRLTKASLPPTGNLLSSRFNISRNSLPPVSPTFIFSPLFSLFSSLVSYGFAAFPHPYFFSVFFFLAVVAVNS